MATNTTEHCSSRNNTEELEVFAAQIRMKAIEMIGNAGKGHIGGSMSIADAIAVLYGGAMCIDPKNPAWRDRDFLVFSKGHAGPALYAALAIKGYFPMEWLATMNRIGTKLPSHVNAQTVPGIDISTGSLGQGLSIAVGLALADMIDRRLNYVYCILGDGECQEGQIWEAAMFAGNRNLNRLVIMVDYNKWQCSNAINKINDIRDIGAKFKDFGFSVIEVDGHNVEQIAWAIERAKEQTKGPSAIILDTIKGRGCSFAEQMENSHCITVSKEGAIEAIAAIQEQLKVGRGESVEY